MSEERILVERDGGIVVWTINRPERYNALDLETVQALHAVLDEAVRADDIDVAILTGAGSKSFVAGADIGELKERGAEDALRGINSSLFRRIEELPFPVIAAVSGYALGGGCELAMACDLRIAGESAKFGQPEVSLGIIPAAGALYRLPRLVGLGRAKELVFTARVIEAEEAERIGLVNHVVPDADVLGAARELADVIRLQGRLAVRVAKATMHAVARPLADPTGPIENLAQAILFESEDKHERMAAAIERRKAKKKKKDKRES